VLTPPDRPNRGFPASALENAETRLLTAEELADFLGVSRDHVYAHADELGAWRLGTGPRARLRFDLEEVRRRLTACPTGRESEGSQASMVERNVRSRRSSRSGSGVELLPIRGQSSAGGGQS
jgi:excisionase family DNA binding protein